MGNRGQPASLPVVLATVMFFSSVATRKQSLLFEVDSSTFGFFFFTSMTFMNKPQLDAITTELLSEAMNRV